MFRQGTRQFLQQKREKGAGNALFSRFFIGTGVARRKVLLHPSMEFT